MTDLVTVGYLHPGHVSTVFADALCELLFYDAAHKQRIVSHPFGKMGKNCGSGGIVDGRNKLASTLLDESQADWLFMVDSDMGFDPDIVERLLKAADAERRPVVGALAFAHKTDGRSSFRGIKYRPVPTLYDFHETDTEVGFIPRFDYNRNALCEVSATGGACMVIHRTALEKIRDQYGPVWFDTIRHPKGAHFSEDMSFCIRLAGVDLPLFVHTGIRTTHDKGGVFLDEAFYDAHMNAKEA